MIKVNLYAVGKIKDGYITQGIEEYSKRLKKYCDFRIVEIKEEPLKTESAAEVTKALSAEADGILKAIKGEYYVFAIEGEKTDSVGFAKILSSKLDRGGELNFVIGSSYGLDDRVKIGAKGKISFSDMTFPHGLFRLCVCEQIYRALTIINGATYHK